jgi:hypothetical protein
VEEITQALAKGNGDEEVGVNRTRACSSVKSENGSNTFRGCSCITETEIIIVKVRQHGRGLKALV